MSKVMKLYDESAYTTPECVIFEMAPEGVLCLSPGQIPDWEENEDVL